MISVQENLQPTGRFSNRAENYLQYRPAYPAEVLRFLNRTMGLAQAHRIADIGSGTGHFAELFLKNGYTVIGVEPNAAMREGAEKRLGSYKLFTLLATRAEKTEIESETIDLVTVAQAFHWMDAELTRREFQRILKPGGAVAIVSTVRKKHTPFLENYDRLKQQFRLEPLPALPDEIRINDFFKGCDIHFQSFPHKHWLDFDGLKGLLLSSSAIPLPGHPSYDTMISTLVQMFVAYNKNGFVEMEYETNVYWSSLSADKY
ncbi:MAG: methyltransferase domain-containing protein [Bacteroidota bacterium]